VRSMDESTTDAMVLDCHPLVHLLVSSMTYTEMAAPASHLETILTKGHQGKISTDVNSVNDR